MTNRFRIKMKRALRGLLLTSVVTFATVLASAQNYSVMSLSGGSGWLTPDGFNALGQVAGTSYTPPSSDYHAFFSNGSSVVDLGTLGGSYSEATGLSALGQVVGYANTAGNSAYHAFFWTQAGGMIDLGTLGGSHSYAEDVNASGQVVGWAYFTNNEEHAFSWTPAGGMVDLNPPGSAHSRALAVNASGQVVGYYTTAGTIEQHAFSWTPAGGMVDLNPLSATRSNPRGLNDSGQVVGEAYFPSYQATRPFSWTQAGGSIDLGTFGGDASFSYAAAVNSTGQVVGNTAFGGGGEMHAFSWTQGGGMLDLNILGGPFSDAFALNAAGQVMGYAYTPGNTAIHAFLWTQAGGSVDLGTLGGNFSFPRSLNASGQVVGLSNTVGNQLRAFSRKPTGGIIDLNSYIPTAPSDTVLVDALAVSDSGLIVAYSNIGLVLLGGSSTAPIPGPISANDPVAVGSPVAVSANFTDTDISETHTALWTWADSTPNATGTVLETNGSGGVTRSHIFTAAGVYPISLKITDTNGYSAQVTRDIVVYDPSAGFVTGGGWILSPPGAFKANQTIVGRATFGFVSKYQKGANKPTGNTEFEFHAARLNFHSEDYDWLVVAGARAKYKGVGTINGAGSYKFMLTAIDGQINGGGGVDRFRIKIWYSDANNQDVVVYDNQTDASGEGTNNEGTRLGGGSIVIHSK